MILAQKWDFEGCVYRPYEIPDGWKCPLTHHDMDMIVNCASCGQVIPFGDTYTSRRIHNMFGFGYMVCAECYDKEWAAERAAHKE